VPKVTFPARHEKGDQRLAAPGHTGLARRRAAVMMIKAERDCGPPGTAGCLRGGDIMDAFVRLVAAGPLFFVSAWLLMIFAGIARADVGIEPFGYVTSMVATIALWLTLAPAIGAVGRAHGKKQC
jgi:hypothetical protein